MRKINALKGTRCLALFASISLSLFIYSCKKDNQEKLENAEIISDVKSWFGSQTSNRLLTTSLFRQSGSNKISALKPTRTQTIPNAADHSLTIDWENAKTYQSSDSTIIEVPVTSDGLFKFNTKVPIEGEKISMKKSFTRLLFIKTATATEGYFMTIINSDEYLETTSNPEQNTFLKKEASFIGTVVYHDFQGKMTNAISIGGIKLLNKKVSVNSQAARGKIMQAFPDECKETDIYQVIGIGCFDIGAYTYCENSYSIYVGRTKCGGGSEPGAGSGGGAGGGGTSNPPVILKVDVDSNARQCLKDMKAALESLGMKNTSKTAGLISDILNKLNLSQGSNFNAIINEGVTANGHLAETIWITDPNNSSNLLTQIKFDSGYLNKLTDLAVAATMMHEYIHAYFDWNIRLMNEGKTGFDANFQATYKFLFDKTGAPLNDQLGTYQHEQMANSFATSIGEMVKKYADSQGITYPADPDYFKKIGWIGLTGTPSATHAPPGTSYTLASEEGSSGTTPLSQRLKCKQ
ncbi:hypothetical protein [Pedobacter kyonggii]|uniref:Uncharacterized protein n=1 Tax=Pedobacter kyonggii TaxID=1926871 RepID=A0A4Q9HHR1_9SPHI|nr:hypothetical protein [Pedobacter kyonggii]TBO45060.1 hypothetical protein EYS08_01635 [Pedobacter kyonggii]